MKKYQLVCPKCKHEFKYDNGYYDREISRLGSEIRDIIQQLSEHNTLSWEQKKARQDWWERTRYALACKQKQIGELKGFRKIADQQTNRMFNVAYRNAVREYFGEEAHKKCLAEAEESISAYSLKSTMKTEYSTSTGRGVTSINKI